MSPGEFEDTVAGLWDAIQTLRADVDGVKTSVSALGPRAEVLAAGEQNWQFLMETKDGPVAMNDLGRVVTVPFDLAEVLLAGGILDATLVGEGPAIEVRRGGSLLARFPVSFVRCMRRVLDAWARSRAAAPPEVGSPASDSRPSPGQRPAAPAADSRVENLEAKKDGA